MVDTRSAIGLLALTSLKGVGPATAERIAHSYSTLDEVVFANPSDLRKIATASVVDQLTDTGNMRFASSKASDILDKAESLDVQVIPVFDSRYPAALRRLDDRPVVLYAKGNITDVERCVACIGTREPSEFGEKATIRISKQLVDAGWIIVSGLAFGVDTLAHTVAVENNSRTIAVMAGGLDSIYPKKNSYLADKILDTNGALISEQPFGTPPSAYNLVHRDRLQSGLSVATFVMQTDIKGGSMHTVRYTLLQDRLLFAPCPQGRHASESKSQGILALTCKSGSSLAPILNAGGDYLRLLNGRFGNQPPAIPLKSRDDYDTVLTSIEHRLRPLDNLPQNSVQTQLAMI